MVNSLELTLFNSASVVFLLPLPFSLVSILHSLIFFHFPASGLFRLSLSPTSVSLHLSFATDSKHSAYCFLFPAEVFCLVFKLGSFSWVLFGSSSRVFPTSGIKQAVELNSELSAIDHPCLHRRWNMKIFLNLFPCCHCPPAILIPAINKTEHVWFFYWYGQNIYAVVFALACAT